VFTGQCGRPAPLAERPHAAAANTNRITRVTRDFTIKSLAKEAVITVPWRASGPSLKTAVSE